MCDWTDKAPSVNPPPPLVMRLQATRPHAAVLRTGRASDYEQRLTAFLKGTPGTRDPSVE
jgi:hypothetical protein